VTAARPTRVNPIPPHHRNVGGGPARAAVFGVSDGLVSNLLLVIGAAGASESQSLVRLVGLMGLLSGAISMGAGEWVSMKTQKELLEREIDKERIELRHRPELERQELAAIYVQRGVSEELADRLSAEIMQNPVTALEIHAREELGVDPNSLGSPWGAAFSSVGSFAVGALVPVLPWLFGGGLAATIGSVVFSAVGSLIVGYLVGYFTGRKRLISSLRQLLIAVIAAAFTYGLGKAIGISVS
jgi:vacuolar iron transporter family protein